MSNNNSVLDIQLLDRKLQIKTPVDKADDLQQAAYLLDSKMREIRSSAQATGNERIALMAALNIAYDLITTQKQKDIYLDSISNRIKMLQDKIDETLAPVNEELF